MLIWLYSYQNDEDGSYRQPACYNQRLFIPASYKVPRFLPVPSIDGCPVPEQTFEQVDKFHWEAFQSTWELEKQRILATLATSGQDLLDVSLQPEVGGALQKEVGKAVKLEMG